MSETLKEKVCRLRQMTTEGQRTWDLSPNDTEAIRLAADVLEMIVLLDVHSKWLESCPCASGATSLFVGGIEFEAGSHLECFAQASQHVPLKAK